MDESSSGFGDESPILFKYPKSFYEVHCLEKNLNLDELYGELIFHLRKIKNINKEDLKFYLEQMDKIKPDDIKNRWLAKKIRGLLKYILKKRSDFQDEIIKGEVVIYGKCNFEQSYTTSVSQTHSISRNSLCSSSDNNIPSCMLTNNNFVSMDGTCDQNIIKKEVEANYNYSQDLFSTADMLHNCSQENYHLLKSLTRNSVSQEINNLQSNTSDDMLFKTPLEINSKIEKVYEMYETVEQDYKSLVSFTPSVTKKIVPTDDDFVKCDNTNTIVFDVTMENSESNKISSVEQEDNEMNIFDRLTDNCQELKNDFNHQLEQTGKWVSEIICNLMKLDIKKKCKPNKGITNNRDNTSTLNNSFESTISTRTTELKTYYSEENYKIIKETCLKFKKNLEKKGFHVLQDFNHLL